MNWIRCLFCSMAYADYSIQSLRPKHFPGRSRNPTVLRADREEVIDPEASVLSDSKGLYDALNNELPQDDKKSAVEIPIIQGMLDRMKGRSRWNPHNFNPADALTKVKGAHSAPLFDLMKSGCYHLRLEEDQLQKRAEEKET